MVFALLSSRASSRSAFRWPCSPGAGPPSAKRAPRPVRSFAAARRLDASPDPAAITDAEGGLLAANRAYEQFLGAQTPLGLPFRRSARSARRGPPRRSGAFDAVAANGRSVRARSPWPGRAAAIFCGRSRGPGRRSRRRGAPAAQRPGRRSDGRGRADGRARRRDRDAARRQSRLPAARFGRGRGGAGWDADRPAPDERGRAVPVRPRKRQWQPAAHPPNPARRRRRGAQCSAPPPAGAPRL